MPRYEVYATRVSSPGIIDELVPATGLAFSRPLNDHGEATFTATKEPGQSFWRSAIAIGRSGILIARDGVPVWDGVVVADQTSGPRSFSFTAKEWGWWFENKVRAIPRQWARPTNDHIIFRQLIDDAQAAGFDISLDTGDTTGATSSIKTDVTAWAKTTVGKEFRSVGATGPDWYITITGTLDNPQRKLYLADRHGLVVPRGVLEYVEALEAVEDELRRPVVSLLGDLFPGPGPLLVPTARAGGNVIAQGRTRNLDNAATEVVAYGAGDQAAQIREPVRADALLAQGWPLMTAFSDDSTVTSRATLRRNAQALLDQTAGVATGYSLVTLDAEPGEVVSADPFDTPRGSNMQVVLDTDVYGAEQPVGGPDGFTSRCFDTVVRVPNSGPAQVEWKVADVLEVR